MAVIPDLDLLYGALQGPFDRLVSHRGITHSLFFGPVVGTLAGWGYWRWLKKRGGGIEQKSAGPPLWIALFVLAMLSHPLLDLCTTYGIQLLMPFSRERFALDAIAIVDPAYSLMLVAGLIGSSLTREWRYSAWCSGTALMLTTAYLFFGLRLNGFAESEARYQLEMAGIEVTEVHAYPTMLQLPHRRLVAFSPSEIRVGFISMWHPCPVQWGSAPILENAYTRTLRATREGQIYEWFSGGLLATRIVTVDDRVQVDLVDLRYGYEPDTLAGMWGIRGVFDTDGNLVKPPERYRDRPEVSWENISGLWADAFPKACHRLADADF
jgi:inner membrane protein